MMYDILSYVCLGKINRQANRLTWNPKPAVRALCKNKKQKKNNPVCLLKKNETADG